MAVMAVTRAMSAHKKPRQDFDTTQFYRNQWCLMVVVTCTEKF